MESEDEDAPSHEAGVSGRQDGDYGTIMETLLKAVKLARRRREFFWEIRSRRKDNETFTDQLDTTRLEIQYAIRGVKASDGNAETEEDLEEEVAEMETTIEKNTTLLSKHQKALDRQDKLLGRHLKRIYALQKHIKNTSFRSDTPQFSPLFWRQLRLLEVGAELVESETNEAKHARSMYILAQAAVREAILLVQANMEEVERDRSRSLQPLQYAVLKLNHAIALCRWHATRLDQMEHTLELRHHKQRHHEMQVMLDLAAPILEAEGLITRDRLRFSQVEEDAPGEPMIFSDDPAYRLTDDHFDELLEDDNEAVRETDRIREVDADLERNYPEYLAQFLRAHPDHSREEFDHEDLIYKKQSAQQIAYAEMCETKLRNRLRKTDRCEDLPRLYDFRLDESDEKHRVPRTVAQLEEKARRFPEAAAKVEQWITTLSIPLDTSLDGQIAAHELPSVDRWKARPIQYQDLDRYSVPSITESMDIQVKKRMLRKFTAACKELRDEILLAKDVPPPGRSLRQCQ